MKTDIKQETAKAWDKTLKTLNESKAGYVQITHEDEQGNKRGGYADLFALSVIVDEKRTTLKDLFIRILDENISLRLKNEELTKGLETVNKLIEENKTEIVGIKQQIYPDFIK